MQQKNKKLHMFFQRWKKDTNRKLSSQVVTDKMTYRTGCHDDNGTGVTTWEVTIYVCFFKKKKCTCCAIVFACLCYTCIFVIMDLGSSASMLEGEWPSAIKYINVLKLSVYHDPANCNFPPLKVSMARLKFTDRVKAAKLL